MTTKKIKSTESKSDSEVVMTVDKKLKFENNTLDTLEAVNTALAYFAKQVSTTLKGVRQFAIGGCASMLLLWLAMNYYGDRVIWSAGIISTAGYWAVVSVLCYLAAVIENRKGAIQ
jgi:hypothetical protein